MLSIKKINLNLFGLLLGFLACFLLIGCGDSGINGDNFSLNVYGYELNYNGKIQLERVLLNNDDLDEVVDLFQEVGDNIGYRDSLLVAEKYSQGLGANAFAQDNLDTLQEQGLTLSNVNKTQVGFEKNGERFNGALVDYEITNGLVQEITLLYVSQLFIPNDDSMILISYITEDINSHLSAMNMLKNIK